MPRLPIVELRSPSAYVKPVFPSSGAVQDKTIVAYIEGSWDCFCAAYVDVLQRAKDVTRNSLSSDATVKLIVGIDDDKVSSLIRS